MINLHERILPTSARVEPATSWTPVGRRIQLSQRRNKDMKHSWKKNIPPVVGFEPGPPG